MKKTNIDHYTDKEALDFHKDKKPGKIEIISSKNMTTKRDLALASVSYTHLRAHETS